MTSTEVTTVLEPDTSGRLQAAPVPDYVELEGLSKSEVRDRRATSPKTRLIPTTMMIWLSQTLIVIMRKKTQMSIFKFMMLLLTLSLARPAVQSSAGCGFQRKRTGAGSPGHGWVDGLSTRMRIPIGSPKNRLSMRCKSTSRSKVEVHHHHHHRVDVERLEVEVARVDTAERRRAPQPRWRVVKAKAAALRPQERKQMRASERLLLFSTHFLMVVLSFGGAATVGGTLITTDPQVHIRVL